MTAGRAPLEGLVVLDFTRILAGPMCTMLLADLGADVIKIERPTVGDDTREWGPPFLAGDASYFLSVNRDKRSIVLDLSDDHDRQTVLELAASADVIVENFRSGVMARFGLGYESVRRANPRLVYCSIPAFSSIESAKPGYDLLMQAASGLMSLTGEDQPVKTGVAIVDVIAGLYATTGVLAALAAREQSGQGQHVTVGLFEASLSALVNQGANYLMSGMVPVPTGNAHPSIVPYQAFHASDGLFVLAAGNDKLFRATAAVVGRPGLADEQRFRTNADRVAHRTELVDQLSDIFATETTDHWVRRCDERGVPAAAVRSLDQVFDSPEGRANVVELTDARRGTLPYVRTPISLSETPLREPSSAPPLLGEHTDEVLGADADRGPDGLSRMTTKEAPL
ncbi:MAG: CaiB/BaiF CoA transferase family protein [Nocardioidaceae bacterium]